MSKLGRALTIAILAAALGAATGGAGLAKITPEPVSCTNPGGQQPGGQQPECKGEGLDQETENRNPAGKAPAGQNK